MKTPPPNKNLLKDWWMNVKLTDIAKASKAQYERFAFIHITYRDIDAPTNDYLLLHKVTELN